MIAGKNGACRFFRLVAFGLFLGNVNQKKGQSFKDRLFGQHIAVEEFNLGASAVSDQDEFYMYLWLFLSRNSEKQYYSQPKSRFTASYCQQKRCWSETADAPVQPGVQNYGSRYSGIHVLIRRCLSGMCQKSILQDFVSLY